MKLLVIGGVTNPSQLQNSEASEELQILRNAMYKLAGSIVREGHEVVICSPFPDSADYHVLHGIEEASKKSPAPPIVSLHYPLLPGVEEAVKGLLSGLGQLNVQRFSYAQFGRDTDSKDIGYAWLFAQLSALETCAGVIAIGGRASGSLNLLLRLADAKKKRVLPLPFLGGAAHTHYDAMYWELSDLLPNDVNTLQDPECVDRVPVLIETMFAVSPRNVDRTFFISYPRARPSEADFVETLLRRRGYVVYRDEEDLEPCSETHAELIKSIERASVFVALWCKEYACSPWCFDEFEIALARHKQGNADLWIICLDETRMVPKAARGLNYYRIETRVELEGKLLFLLDKLQEKDKP